MESATGDARPAGPFVDAPRHGRMKQYWPNGNLRSDASYQADVDDGECRTYYESGAPYELRRYRLGHEDGVQRS